VGGAAAALLIMLTLSGIVLLASGVFAIVQASTGHFLPHDVLFLGMTAEELCRLQGCRIVHFMIHDRISFGGVLIAIGVLYIWLTSVLQSRRESWAWWALAASGAAGFLSFLSYLGHGYLDTWHGAATLLLLPLFAGGLFRSRALRCEALDPLQLDLHSGNGLGRALLLLTSVGISVAGLTIMIFGMTRVFVPQDLEYIGMTREAIDAINPNLIPLIAHDRAGFGGALVSFGVAMFACVRYGRMSPALWHVLAGAGIAGFTTAVGVHPVIGYVNPVHLAPAIFACGVFAVGLALLRGVPGPRHPYIASRHGNHRQAQQQ
jgi:hypothetical protein